MDFSMQFFRGPNQTIDNTNKGSNNEEYCRTLKPEHEVSYKISDQQEGAHQAKQNPQPTTNEMKWYAETKLDVTKDDTDQVLIPTGGDPVSNDTAVEDNAEDKNKNGAPSTDTINHVKEVELIKKDTGAIAKSHPNETEITRKSSFRITSVTDTVNT